MYINIAVGIFVFVWLWSLNNRIDELERKVEELEEENDNGVDDLV